MRTSVLLIPSATAWATLLLPVSPIRRHVKWRFDVFRWAALFLFVLFAVALLLAVKPNPKLVSLVPPNARMVAGFNVPPRSGQSPIVVLSSRYNKVDLKDFIALIGADPYRAVEQIIMVTSDENGADLAGHSLMASGRFDRARIYAGAYAAGAKAIEYHGISVLEIQPFSRESDSFHDVRWLAIIDSKLAMFGTSGLLQQELERYLDHSVTDPALEQKLGRLRHDDATWCVATVPDHESEIQALFQALDSRFTDLLRRGDTIQIGIHYGRQVEFEYEVGMASDRNPDVVRRFLEQPSPEVKESFLLPAPELTGNDNGVRGVLKVPKARYEAWKAEVMEGSNLRAAAAASSP